MKLTKTQIQELYKFTQKHYVYYYDVQTELVDHLANDIEEIWKEKPQLSFENARDFSFKKFGVFGFMHVIEAKQKQMNKRYRKILWRFSKEWFTLPKIIFTGFLLYIIYEFLQFQFSEVTLLISFLTIIIVDFYRVIKSGRQKKQKQKNNDKIFLLESMILSTRKGLTGIVFINLFNLLYLTKTSISSFETHWLFLISLIVTILLILFYVSTFVIPKKAEELLEDTYPEYKLSKNL